MCSIGLLMLLIPGCSLMIPPDDGQKPDLDQMAPLIQARTRYVAAFAFSMDAVKPHKQAVCDAAIQISEFLATYDDKDASFENLQMAILAYIQQIENPNVRNAVTIVIDMVLTEAFNYAWQHYEDFINQDQTRAAIIVASAVADGLTEACALTMGSATATQIFTVEG